MNLPTDTFEWATNITAELLAPDLTFAKEGFKTQDTISHELMNYYFNLSYKYFKAIQDGFIVTINDIATLKAINTTDTLNNSLVFVKDIDIIVKFSTETPIMIGDDEFIIIPTSGGGFWENYIMTVTTQMTLLEALSSSQEKINFDNDQKIKILIEKLTNIEAILDVNN